MSYYFYVLPITCNGIIFNFILLSFLLAEQLSQYNDWSTGRTNGQRFVIFFSAHTDCRFHPFSYHVGTRSKRTVMKITTQFHLVPRIGKVELYLHSPIRVYGVVLNNHTDIVFDFIFVVEIH